MPFSENSPVVCVQHRSFNLFLYAAEQTPEPPVLGGNFVASNQVFNPSIKYSTDGDVWTESELTYLFFQTVQVSDLVFYGFGFLDIPGSNYLFLRSIDGGVTWTNEGSTNLIYNGTDSAVSLSYNDGVFVLSLTRSASNHRVYRSVDFLTFTQTLLITDTAGVQCIKWLNGAWYLLQFTNETVRSSVFYVSDDAITWATTGIKPFGDLAGPVSASYGDLIYLNGQFMLCGRGSDGINPQVFAYTVDSTLASGWVYASGGAVSSGVFWSSLSFNSTDVLVCARSGLNRPVFSVNYGVNWSICAGDIFTTSGGLSVCKNDIFSLITGNGESLFSSDGMTFTAGQSVGVGWTCLV